MRKYYSFVLTIFGKRRNKRTLYQIFLFPNQGEFIKKGIISHIEIYVDDLAKTIDFWHWFLADLGYSEFQKWDAGISYKLDDTYLVFVQAEEKHCNREFHRCKPGLNHLAFYVNSRAEVDRFYHKVKQKGMTILYKNRHPFAGGENYYALFFEDPNRLKVEVVVYK